MGFFWTELRVGLIFTTGFQSSAPKELLVTLAEAGREFSGSVNMDPIPLESGYTSV